MMTHEERQNEIHRLKTMIRQAPNSNQKQIWSELLEILEENDKDG
jgi:nitrogenase subunit NifH